MTAALYLAAGMRDERLRKHTSDLEFPSELDTLELNSLMTLVAFLGTMGQGARAKQSAYIPTSLRSTIELLRSAGSILANWPNGFHRSLSTLQKNGPQPGDAITLKDAFGNHFRGLVGLGHEFRFLRVVFENFLAIKWPGVIRKQHRSFSESFHSQYPWVTAQEAKHITNIAIPRLLSLVRTQKLEGKFVMPQGGHRRNECWIRRSSLNDLINHRDMEHQQYLSQGEVARTLGLSIASVAELGECDVLSSVDGPEKHLPRGKYYGMWDVRRLRSLCVSLWGPEFDVKRSQEFISLADARQKLLGGKGTLARVFTALIDGSLLPVGHASSSGTAHFNDLVFRRSELREYAIPTQSRPLPTGFIHHKEAACRLGTNPEVVRNLAAEKLLFSPAEPFNRFRVVSLKDVESFGRTYIGIQTLADRFKTQSAWVARYLKAEGVMVLTIGLPGKGKKLFVRRSDVAEIVIPPAKRARPQTDSLLEPSHAKETQ